MVRTQYITMPDNSTYSIEVEESNGIGWFRVLHITPNGLDRSLIRISRDSSGKASIRKLYKSAWQIWRFHKTYKFA